MDQNNNPAKTWAISSITCALICIFGSIFSVCFVFLSSSSLNGFALLALIVIMIVSVIGFAILGIIFGVIAFVRLESPKMVKRGLLLNFLVLASLGLFYLFGFVIPKERSYQKGKLEREEKKAHYLATRTPKQHLFDVARRQGDIKEMKELLDNDIDPNLIDERGISLIVAAINFDYHGDANVEAVCLLLYSGADPERRDENGWTALHHACASGSVVCVSELFHHGVDLKALTSKGETSLDLINQKIVISCDCEEIKFLLAKYSGKSDKELEKIIEETPCRQHKHNWTQMKNIEPFKHRHPLKE